MGFSARLPTVWPRPRVALPYRVATSGAQSFSSAGGRLSAAGEDDPTTRPAALSGTPVSREPGASPSTRDESGGGADLRSVVADGYEDWEAIYFDNVGRVYRLMFSRVGNRNDAEDLPAEVFLAALRPLRVSASVGEVRAYLVATAQTVLATFWRKRYGSQVTVVGIDAALEFLLDRGVDEQDIVAEAKSSERLAEIMARLPQRYRRILELRFLEGCSVKEAAVELDVSAGNARVLQHRALRRAGEIAEEVAT